MLLPKKLKAMYDRGENITQYLRKTSGSAINTDQIIEMAYDFQAGTYIEKIKSDPIIGRQKQMYVAEIAKRILDICNPLSILNPGVGEATILSGVLDNMPSDLFYYGFDLSWSRVAAGIDYMQIRGYNEPYFCTGSMSAIPFQDNAFDVVFTSHSLEANGGKEQEIIKELYRVTSNALFLLEPSFEHASLDGKKRMQQLGYCSNIREHCETLGINVVDHELFAHSINPMNPTAITIIIKSKRKRKSEYFAPPGFACPIYSVPLQWIDNVLYGDECLYAYPVIRGVPCLRPENAVLATYFRQLHHISSS